MSEIKCGKRAKKTNSRFVGRISQKDPQKSLIFHSFSPKMALFETLHQIKGDNVTKTLQGLVTKKRLKK